MPIYSMSTTVAAYMQGIAWGNYYNSDTAGERARIEEARRRERKEIQAAIADPKIKLLSIQKLARYTQIPSLGELMHSRARDVLKQKTDRTIFEFLKEEIALT